MAFFKDILNTEFKDSDSLWNKIQERKRALVKHGYWTIEGDITELGYDRLIRFLMKEPKP